MGIRYGAVVLLVVSFVTGPAASASHRPANDDRADAVQIGELAFEDRRDTSGATLEEGEPQPCNIGATVWYEFTAPDSMTLTANTFGSNFDTVLAVYEQGDDDAITCNDEASSNVFNDNAEIRFDAVEGTTYEFQVGGFDGKSGNQLVFSVADTAGPANDDLADAAPIEPGETKTQITTRATLEEGEPLPCNIGATVWYEFTASDSATLTANTFDSNFDTVLAVYEQTGSGLADLTEITCNDDSPNGPVYRSQVVFEATAGNSYVLQAGGFFGARGTLSLELVEASSPPNNDFASATEVTDAPFTDEIDTDSMFFATLEGGEPQPVCGTLGPGVGRTVWYTFSPQGPGLVRIDTDGSSFDTTVALYRQTGAGLEGLSEQACNDDRGFDRQSLVAAPVLPGETYYLQVGGWDGAFGDLSVTIDFPGS